MTIKTQRLTGVALFLLPVVLGFIGSLLASDDQVNLWFQANRSWILSFAALFILTGMVVVILSIGKDGTKTTAKYPEQSGDTTGSDEDIQFLRRQLATHQKNRRKLLEQKSVYAAGQAPLSLLNQIEAEEKQIAEIERKLTNQ